MEARGGRAEAEGDVDSGEDDYSKGEKFRYRLEVQNVGRRPLSN